MAAFNASNPVNIMVGEVIESKPLKIEVHSKLILTDEFLLVAEHLTKHDRVVTIEHVELTMRETGDGQKMDYLDTDDRAAPITSYLHHCVKLTFEDGLKKGDKVILHRVQGGSEYFVSDRYKEGDSVW